MLAPPARGQAGQEAYPTKTRRLGGLRYGSRRELVCSAHGRSTLARCGWHAGRVGTLCDRAGYGVRGRVSAHEPGDCGRILLEFLWKQYVRHYADSDVDRGGDAVLERTQRVGMVADGGGRAVYSGGGDRQHAYLLSAGDVVPYNRDAGIGGWRSGTDRARDPVGRRMRGRKLL